jgi:hypothetical protein
MPLPNLQHPKFDVKLPSNGKIYSFRPYTVKEQKILLMLKESIDSEEVSGAIKTLITSCCLSGEIPVDKLTYFDIEYIFLQIRINSVGEISKLSYVCNNIIDNNKCGQINSLELNLREIDVDFSDASKNNIDIGRGLTLNLSYPGINSTKDLQEYDKTRNLDTLFKIIYNDVNYIADSEQIWDDFTESEFIEFLNNLDIESFESILNFYLNVPKLKKEIIYKCKKCNYTENIILEGISDFFE